MVVAAPISQDSFGCNAVREIPMHYKFTVSRTSCPVFALGVVGMFPLLIGSALLAVHALFCDLLRPRWHRR